MSDLVNEEKRINSLQTGHNYFLSCSAFDAIQPRGRRRNSGMGATSHAFSLSPERGNADDTDREYDDLMMRWQRYQKTAQEMKQVDWESGSRETGRSRLETSERDPCQAF